MKNQELTKTYERIPSFVKMKRSDVLAAIRYDGAILEKCFGVYSHYVIHFPDGTKHYNLRSDAVRNMSDEKDIYIFSRDVNGYSYKLKENN